MATSRYRIVPGDDSEIHEDPHLPDRRITVRDIHDRVETRGLDPETVATRFTLDIAEVYEILAYYTDVSVSFCYTYEKGGRPRLLPGFAHNDKW